MKEKEKECSYTHPQSQYYFDTKNSKRAKRQIYEYKCKNPSIRNTKTHCDQVDFILRMQT